MRKSSKSKNFGHQTKFGIYVPTNCLSCLTPKYQSRLSRDQRINPIERLQHRTVSFRETLRVSGTGAALIHVLNSDVIVRLHLHQA